MSKFDESTIKAKLGLVNFKQTNASLDVSIDKLNLDRYFPPTEKKETETDVAVAPVTGHPSSRLILRP